MWIIEIIDVEPDSEWTRKIDAKLCFEVPRQHARMCEPTQEPEATEGQLIRETANEPETTDEFA